MTDEYIREKMLFAKAKGVNIRELFVENENLFIRQDERGITRTKFFTTDNIKYVNSVFKDFFASTNNFARHVNLTAFRATPSYELIKDMDEEDFELWLKLQ